ncbi:16S rRNA (guanine(527)-N(7))-methyltransferase RsmG [Candidatus Gracilibacteria bacterium]|nr:16S rRNA (guanine(527)-N(7))-methyltransferase RsmG [Candidatus Gracilibacteria bacterium]
MQSIFQKYHIELSESELEKFQKFLEIFMETNSQINLSAIRDEAGIIEKHFVDSIMLAVFYDIQQSPTQYLSPTLPSQGREQAAASSLLAGENGVRCLVEKIRVADLGTGGGFPGIPLAIVAPQAEFTLIDSVAKKLKCIDEFAEKLELDNIETLVGRAEEIGQNPEYRESFDLVTSRATAYFPTLLEYTLPLLKVGGVFAAYKLTDKEEFASMKKALIRLGGKILKIKNYEIDGQERSIVFIEKITKTHAKYPRKVGIPLQNPIV